MKNNVRTYHSTIAKSNLLGGNATLRFKLQQLSEKLLLLSDALSEDLITLEQYEIRLDDYVVKFLDKFPHDKPMSDAAHVLHCTETEKVISEKA